MEGQGVAALVYDYLKKNVSGLAETFKTKVNPVSKRKISNNFISLRTGGYSCVWCGDMTCGQVRGVIVGGMKYR